jgi:hypothetical protein
LGIDGKGFEEALKGINELGKRLNPLELARWTNTIDNTAKQLCPKKRGDIQVKHTQGIEFNISYNDKESRDCIIRAIESHIRSMPPLLQVVFEKLLKDLKDGLFDS